MHFTRSILAFAIVAVTAVQAAPGLSTSLTKRWCGYEHTCKCKFDLKTRCIPNYDKCGKQWYWPPQCKGCAPCLELCVDLNFCVTIRRAVQGCNGGKRNYKMGFDRLCLLGSSNYIGRDLALKSVEERNEPLGNFAPTAVRR
ncbi:hypothetical protein B0H19DRAFT_1322546 [Mycena capillaripes]|nr:hypothetical protein B0H19DRAFT_1322546 [Mycena capillaripes]